MVLQKYSYVHPNFGAPMLRKSGRRICILLVCVMGGRYLDPL
ncbi:hypothetical protein CIPAW_14G133200 [Carya illinoinensis]|uniref:Uncharacterized protein n=1 Tax=Carya illinoinensis TaxID=32201 RepID=A0A8T1NLU3_CARIL|nr:hypothetical protein CIPAW_14G133200 [Carya illinoinensis]